MQEDDHDVDGDDIEEWARQLASKPSTGPVPHEVKALRDAIEASNQADSAALAADRVSRARLIKRLEEQSLLEAAPAATRPRRSWQIWASALAAVFIVAIVVRFAVPPEPVYRGFAGTITITNQQPDLERARITRQLQELGLKPREVVEDGQVLLEVEVVAEQLEAFYQWAQQQGGRPVTPGKYRILIESATRKP